MGTRQEDETIFVPSSPVLNCESHIYYTPSVGCADQSLRKLVQHEARRQEYRAILRSGEYVLQVFEFISEIKTLSGTVTTILADSNSARKRRARDQLSQTLGYDCMVSRYTTESEEGLARKKCRLR